MSEADAKLKPIKRKESLMSGPITPLPLLDTTRSDGSPKMCTRCLTAARSKSRSRAPQNLLLLGTLFFLGGFIIAGNAPFITPVRKLFEADIMFSALGVLAAITVAASLTASQIIKDRQVLDQVGPASALPPEDFYRRRSSLNAGQMCQIVAIAIIGLLTGTLASLFAISSQGRPDEVLAAIIAYFITLWIALELSRLLDDPLPAKSRKELAAAKLTSIEQSMRDSLSDWEKSQPKRVHLVLLAALICTSLVAPALELTDHQIDNYFILRTLFMIFVLAFLAFMTVWAGRDLLFDDHQSWGSSLQLIMLSIVFSAVIMVVIIGAQIRPAQGASSLAAILWISLADWVLWTIILVLLLRGASGLGVCRVLAVFPARSFVNLAEKNEAYSKHSRVARKAYQSLTRPAGDTPKCSDPTCINYAPANHTTKSPESVPTPEVQIVDDHSNRPAISSQLIGATMATTIVLSVWATRRKNNRNRRVHA